MFIVCKICILYFKQITRDNLFHLNIIFVEIKSWKHNVIALHLISNIKYTQLISIHLMKY